MAFQPWPWFVVGPIIAFTMASLLLLGKRFGLSSNLRSLCTIAGAGGLSDYFQFDWRAQRWNLIFVAGTIAGGALARFGMMPNASVELSATTAKSLQEMGVSDAGNAFAPALLFGPKAWSNPMALVTLLLGGVFVGFGTRWANGCTSGHAISGLSALQWPSFIAVIGFFAGGLLIAHFFLPWLLPLL